MIKVGANKWPYPHKVPKDPDAVLDYALDWSDWLGEGESIVGAAWTVSDELAIEAETLTATTTTVWLSGGTVGIPASITCRITTDSVPVARVDDRTLLLTIAHR